MSSNVQTQTQSSGPTHEATTQATSAFATRPFTSQRGTDTAANLEAEGQLGKESGQVSAAGRDGKQQQLVLTPPDDKYEQEADQIAQQVTSDTTSGGNSTPDELRINHSVSKSGRVQGIPVGTVVEESLARPNGSGSPLPHATRDEMSRRLGHDFGTVRIHTDKKAERINQHLGTKAFTYGKAIYLRGDKYRPHTRKGKRLVAHELVHVVHQNGKRDGMIQADREDEERRRKSHEKYAAGTLGLVGGIAAGGLGIAMHEHSDDRAGKDEAGTIIAGSVLGLIGAGGAMGYRRWRAHQEEKEKKARPTSTRNIKRNLGDIRTKLGHIETEADSLQSEVSSAQRAAKGNK